MQQLFADESLALLIAASRRRIKQVAWELTRPHGVTPQQFGIIMTLYSKGSQSLSTLADRMGVDNPTACRLLNKLSERKLVQTEVDPADRRRFCIELTAKGRKLGDTLIDSAHTLADAIEFGFSASEGEALRHSLRRVMANMDTLAERLATQKRPTKKK